MSYEPNNSNLNQYEISHFSRNFTPEHDTTIIVCVGKK